MPLGVHATYLVRDGFVLELIDYSKREVRAGTARVMDQVGLTHISFSVSDFGSVLEKVAEFGGLVVEGTVSQGSAMIRDPDGQLLELLADQWLAGLPAAALVLESVFSQPFMWGHDGAIERRREFPTRVDPPGRIRSVSCLQELHVVSAAYLLPSSHCDFLYR
ncbi:hypothetical protein MHEI_37540 [Mycobacterium heidelbergense]|nr:hypothetical protein MHEI_37540 [Mycobacterium heidelbergense]